MRRLLLLALAAASIAPASAYAATKICVPTLPYNCVYSDGGYWCTRQTGPNGNWTEQCVGATGYRECVHTFPAHQDPDEADCREVPGQITR